MKVKNVLVALVVLSCVPPGSAGNKSAYPQENVAQFVVDKLDLTSLPSAFRPKKEKGKKTFVDYGFQPQEVHENDAVMSAADRAKSLSLKVLDHTPAGIFVCIARAGVKGDTASESVVLLKWNDHEGSLKGRATLREFAECPPIGGGDASESSY